MKREAFVFVCLLTVASVMPLCGQDHGHLRIGARSTTQGAPLYFYNGSDFASTSSYVKTLIFTNSGRYSNYYQGNITFTVQAATEDFLGPEPDHPAPGSYVRARMLSVNGPPGGAFAFWENGATSPTISLASGQTGTSHYRVTQTDGSPGTDPFGHIHGRRFTATKPGVYTVRFQVFDTSVNGTGGGPIHTPSEVIEIAFQAGVTIAIQPDREAGNVRIRCGAMAGFHWQVQYATELGSAMTWQSFSPIGGDDYFKELIDAEPPNGRRYYRLMGTPMPPP